MREQTITEAQLNAFRTQLLEEERSAATIEKYMLNVRQFAMFLDNADLTKTAVAKWKKKLLERCAPSTVNGKLTALDRFLQFLGAEECCVRHLKIQRKLFREAGRDLSREEYLRLLSAARGQGKERLSLLMESICATGIRVSEVCYLTVEAVPCGRAEVALKGKIRTILIPSKLCRRLLKYAKKMKIASGEIFLTRSGRGMSRKQIWAEMKKVCAKAGVEPEKVFPHNLRHLFARSFYQACRDVAGLADVLGHSSIETTRIYLISTGMEYARTMEGLRLLS